MSYYLTQDADRNTVAWRLERRLSDGTWVWAVVHRDHHWVLEEGTFPPETTMEAATAEVIARCEATEAEVSDAPP